MSDDGPEDVTFLLTKLEVSCVPRARDWPCSSFTISGSLIKNCLISAREGLRAPCLKSRRSEGTEALCRHSCLSKVAAMCLGVYLSGVR